jgi:catechol 2,3-dioxygenase-like lactoylglutathione lyase family enzyme
VVGRYGRLVRFDQIKFLTNDVAGLARFYVDALDCEVVIDTQEVDEVVSRAVGVPEARVTLSILRLPGRGDHGPVLELYSIEGPRPDGWGYVPGGGQIAFEVEDLEAAIGRLISSGASLLGEVVEWTGPSGAVARFVYLNDPEGNIIDLFQRIG